MLISYNMKKLMLTISVLIIILSFISIDKEEKINKTYVNDNQVVIVNYNDKILNMTLRDYLIGVVSCEMPALFQEEALKAGAVAARTFYMNKYISDINYVPTNNDQCFKDEKKLRSIWNDKYEIYYKKIEKAVADTKNLIISYDDRVIESFYFSMSNGYTENVESVFKINRPYLVSVESTWENTLKNQEVSTIFSLSDFKNILNINNDRINPIIKKNNNDRVEKICVDSICYTGIEFRKLFNLRSTDFDIEILENSVLIKTRGYGHGVGMSQYGANEMAKLNYTFDNIIKYYYTGVEIKNYYV